MGICVANAHAKNGVAINHRHDFVMRCDERFPLSRQEGYHTTTIPKAAQREFSNHGRMAEKTIVLNNPTQLCIGMSEMINPDGSVSKYHLAAALRRRGAASASGIVPPSAMRRFPDSTRTSVSNAWRTRAEVSFVPVRDLALSMRVSSRLIVERIAWFLIPVLKIAPFGDEIYA